MWLYLKNNAGIVIANQKAVEFLTGYLIEKSLSIDNVFVIIMIFSYFSIPPEYQRRVLIYGVIGAIIMRLILIMLGIFLVSEFFWILYLFGLFLIITGVKMFVFVDYKPDLSKNPALIWMRNHLRITQKLYNEKFYIKRNSVLYFTPLFIVLVLVEITDLIFAVDSMVSTQ